MAKDPAFLFYSKDWIEGTAEMLPAEKGVYIDFLCHQHQAGDLPNDMDRLARIARLSKEDFLKIWAGLSEKFIEIKPGRLANLKLIEVTTDRQIKGHKNSITGTFAALCRGLDLPKKKYLKLKSLFKIEEFIPLPTKVATERLTERFTEWLKSIEDENENAIEDEDINKDKGGVGEKGTESQDALAIIEYLNIRAGTKFKGSKADCGYINARLKEGFTVGDLKQVIDTKTVEWLQDPKMNQYLRPSTLFNSEKFEGYLNQKIILNAQNQFTTTSTTGQFRNEADRKQWERNQISAAIDAKLQTGGTGQY